MSNVNNDIQSTNTLNFVRDLETNDFSLTGNWESKALYIYLQKQVEILLETVIAYENPNIIKSIISQKILEKSVELGVEFNTLASIIKDNPKLYNFEIRGKNERQN